MLEYEEDVSAQLACTIPQGVVVRLAFSSFLLIVGLHPGFVSGHIVGRPDQSVS